MMGTIAREIEKRLTEAFAPTELSVEDESHLHEGHSGWREGGQTHFWVGIRSAAFNGKSRIDRHRMVNAALEDLMGNPVHALAVKAEPEE